MRRRGYGSLSLDVFVCLCVCVCVCSKFFLNVTSNSCKLSFHVLTKKFIDGKPLKKLAGKNTALRKFHVKVHLMTPVDREGIVS